MLLHLPSATAMMGVPTFYTRMLSDARLTAASCAHMRLFVSGSAPLLNILMRNSRNVQVMPYWNVTV